MYYAEFESIIGTDIFRGSLLPQAEHIITHCLYSAKETLEVDAEFSGYTSFNVLGFDLMVDEDLKVWLIEVNSSPAVAEDLLGDLTRDLVERQITPYFFPDKEPKPDNGWVKLQAPTSGP